MNQALKDAIYGKGTQLQVDYMARIGGMNEIEREMFQLIHDGRTDLYIQNELGLSQNAFRRIEEQMRQKLVIAVFHCIDTCILNSL